MEPDKLIEFTLAAAALVMLFGIAWILPKKIRSAGLTIASSVTILLVLFFLLRPFWIDYQVVQKTESLNAYLKRTYPGQEWKISPQTGGNSNPYHLDVKFGNEEDWTYIYSVAGEQAICQAAWIPPEGKGPADGEHFENGCE